jgi:hypothetical protein
VGRDAEELPEVGAGVGEPGKGSPVVADGVDDGVVEVRREGPDVLDVLDELLDAGPGLAERSAKADGRAHDVGEDRGVEPVPHVVVEAGDEVFVVASRHRCRLAGREITESG